MTKLFGGSPARFAPQTLFTKSHEWVRFDSAADAKKVTIGVSDFAQKELGDIVFIDFQGVGDEIDKGDSVCAIECGDGKAVGEVYAPQNCEVTAVNETLPDEPAIVNQDCEGKGWLVEVECKDPFAPSNDLMERGDYEKFLETVEKHH